MKKLLLVAIAALGVMPFPAAARHGVAVFVGVRPAPFGWYGPVYRPYPYAPYAVVPNAGQVKLEVPDKNAQVFVNGAYAGTVHEMKTMWLHPGAYNLEIRGAARPYAERIYVVAGKTIHIRPEGYRR